MTSIKMSILIIGGCGFIGSHIAEALQSSGDDLIIFDRNADRQQSSTQACANYIKGEFGNRGELSRIFEKHVISHVVHLAASTLPSSSNRDPEFDVVTNVCDTIALLDLCVQHSVGKILFLSSGGTVYGIPRYLPINEDHPTDPICSYGITKLAVEKYLQLYNHLYGLDFVALRAANPYGPRQLPTARQGVISVFAFQMLCGNEIVIWGDGDVVRDYFHIRDLADLCILALKAPVSGVFNAGSGVGRSLRDVIASLERVIGCDARVHFEKGRALDVPRVVLDHKLAQQAFGWNQKIGFEEGLQSVKQWLLKEWIPGPSEPRASR